MLAHIGGYLRADYDRRRSRSAIRHGAGVPIDRRLGRSPWRLPSLVLVASEHPVLAGRLTHVPVPAPADPCSPLAWLAVRPGHACGSGSRAVYCCGCVVGRFFMMTASTWRSSWVGLNCTMALSGSLATGMWPG